MASRIYDYAESLGNSTYGAGTTYQTKASLTKTPSPNSTVFIYYSAIIGNNSLTPLHKSRLYNSTTATVLCEHQRNPKDTTDLISVHGFAVETFGASPSSQTWRIDYGTTDVAGSTSISNARLSYLELDAAEFYEADPSAIVATDTNRVTVLTMTETLANGVDYYVLCCAAVDTASTASSGRAQIRAVHNGTDYGSMDYDFGQITESIPWMTILKITGDGTSKTVTISLNSSGTSDVNAAYNYIAAFRADKFPGVFYDESRARSTTTTASDQDKVTSTHTPAAKAYLSFACGIIDINSTTSSSQCKFVKGATNYGEHIHEANTTGASGGGMSYGVGVIETQAASSTTWKTQYRPETAAVTAGFSESAILHLQVEDSGGGVTANPSGVSGTGGVGSPAATGTASVAPSGLAGTGSAGTVAASVSESAALTGSSATGAVGTPAAMGTASVALTGPGGTGQAGSPAASVSESTALSGLSATAQVGTTPATGNAETALTGTGGTGSVGTVTGSGTASTALSGLSGSGGIGSPIADGGAADTEAIPNGLAASGSAGTITATGGAAASLAGLAGASAIGTPSATGDASASLAGSASTGTPGSPTATGSAEAFPSGSAGTGQAGTATGAGSAQINLSGVSGLGQVGTAAALDNTEAILTGLAASTAVGSVIPAGSALVTVVGISATGQVSASILVLIPSGLNVIRVAAEDRRIRVRAEDRTIAVANDNRVIAVAAQNRTISVNAQSRVIRVAA